MGRRSGLGTVIKVVKAIDRANKKAIRESEKKARQEEREQARINREQERFRREQEKRVKAERKEIAAKKKAAFKLSVEEAKSAFDKRCLERKKARERYVIMELK